MQPEPDFDDHENPYSAPRSDIRPESAGRDVGPPARAEVRFEVIGQAWDLFKAQMSVWLPVALIALAINFGISMVSNVATQLIAGALQSARADDAVVAVVMVLTFLVSMLVSLIVQSFVTAGMFRVACKQVRGEMIAVNDMFQATDVIPSVILASILVGLATLGGALFCIIPGLLIAGRLMFTMPLVADGRQTAVQAMKTSWRALEGQTWISMAFVLIVGIVSQVGACACLIGLLFTMPLYFLAIALLYRDFFPGKAKPVDPWLEPGLA